MKILKYTLPLVFFIAFSMVSIFLTGSFYMHVGRFFLSI
jgi:hypothetical protein